MKKTTAILLAVITAFSCLFIAGCGSTAKKEEKPAINTNALDRIRIFESSKKEEKGKEIVTLKGEASNAMGYLSQLYAETKSKSESPKKDVSKADKVYFFEILNYTDEGKAKESNYIYIYYIGKKVYCYYKEKQSFGDGDFYINGYTNVKQEDFNNMINGGAK